VWRRDETKDPENGDAGTPKLMTHGCPRNAQLGTDLAQGLARSYKAAVRLRSTGHVTARRLCEVELGGLRAWT
jgi:hypothetical protein